ncbi:MAG: hypothetical protein ACYCX4_10715 [Bacillota bacterium]
MKTLSRICIILFLTIATLLPAQTPVAAQALPGDPSTTSSPRKILMFVLDRSSLSDWALSAAPNLSRLIREGAMGLMNTKSPGSRIPENAYATIGAGKMVAAGSEGGQALNASEIWQGSPAGQLYSLRTGNPAPKGSVVLLSIAQAREANTKLKTNGVPGTMGTTLSMAGYQTAVIGNSDTLEDMHRYGALMVMDEKGEVPIGDVGRGAFRKDQNRLTSIVTDYNRLYRDFLDSWPKVQVLALELGDRARLEESAAQVLPAIRDMEKLRMIREADTFIGRVMANINGENTLVAVVSPFPSEVSIKNNDLLTPLALWGSSVTPGMLTSGTTRRPGIISNTDLAPTFLNYLGVPVPPSMTGRSLYGIASPTTVMSYLQEMNQKNIFVHQARPYLVKGYIITQIAIVVLALLALIFRYRWARKLKPVILGLMAVPLALLILGGMRQDNLLIYAMEAIGVTVLLVAGALSFGRKHELEPFILVCLATMLALAADTVGGSSLQLFSTLGYDPMSGARYYGIGNEFMGVVVGAGIIGVTALHQRLELHRKKLLPVTGAVLALVTVIIMAPQLGANVDPTAVVAFGYTYICLWGVKVSLKQITLLGASAATLLVALAWIDFNRATETQSHLGRFATSVQTGGVVEIWNVAARKWAMNLKLIRYTIWSRVFIVTLLSTVVLFHWPVEPIRRIQQRYPYLTQGFLAVFLGAGVALVTNDSGIVAAATMAIFAAAPLIYMVLEEREISGESFG